MSNLNNFLLSWNAKGINKGLSQNVEPPKCLNPVPSRKKGESSIGNDSN